MNLLCILTLNGLIHNRQVSVIYIRLKDNILSDTFSRLDFKRFQREGARMNEFPDAVPEQINSAQNIFLMN